VNIEDHINIAKTMLQPGRKRATPWVEDGYVDVPPTADDLLTANAHATIALSEAVVAATTSEPRTPRDSEYLRKAAELLDKVSARNEKVFIRYQTDEMRLRLVNAYAMLAAIEKGLLPEQVAEQVYDQFRTVS